MEEELKRKSIVYAAVITKEDNKYYSSLIDFDRLNDGSLDYYALKSIYFEKLVFETRENLIEKLFELYNNKRKYPKPSDINDIKLGGNQFVYYISVDPEYEIAKETGRFKKKTVMLPQWLNAIALDKNIKFSKILRRALIKELGLE